MALANDAVNKAEELNSLDYELSLKNQQLDMAEIRINRINSEKQSALNSIDSEEKKRDAIMEEFERQKEISIKRKIENDVLDSRTTPRAIALAPRNLPVHQGRGEL